MIGSTLKRATLLKTIHHRLSHIFTYIATFPKSWDIHDTEISLNGEESYENISQPAGFEPARGNPIKKIEDFS